MKFEKLSIKKFENTEIKPSAQNAILGGGKTTWTTASGGSGTDTKDSDGCITFSDGSKSKGC
jgi:hypothetical protein